MPSIEEVKTGQTTRTATTPLWWSGIWECGDRRFTDQHGDLYRVGPPEISTVKFKLLWKIPELISIDVLIAPGASQDKVAATFMGLLNDPKTQTVDMSLESVQGGIGYVLSKVYPGDETKQAARLAEILTGEVK